MGEGGEQPQQCDYLSSCLCLCPLSPCWDCQHHQPLAAEHSETIQCKSVALQMFYKCLEFIAEFTASYLHKCKKKKKERIITKVE